MRFSPLSMIAGLCLCIIAWKLGFVDWLLGEAPNIFAILERFLAWLEAGLAKLAAASADPTPVPSASPATPEGA